jgi:uncharacterized membrane protein HdeD (DUF308 family)
MLAFGILTIAAGICALVWPGITLLAAAIVFGVQLIVAGVYRLVAAFAVPVESTGTRVMLGVLGVLSLIIACTRSCMCCSRSSRSPCCSRSPACPWWSWCS